MASRWRLAAVGAAGVALSTAVALWAPSAWAGDIAQETGGHAELYADAVEGPATDTPCDVSLRFVRARTLEPLTGGFQFAVDTEIDVSQPMADYHIDLDADGRWRFGGGHLRELTSDFKDGVLLIRRAPKYFHVEAAFGPGRTASATIQRQCVGPTSQLIYVVDNPDAGVEGGDWLWVKR